MMIINDAKAKRESALRLLESARHWLINNKHILRGGGGDISSQVEASSGETLTSGGLSVTLQVSLSLSLPPPAV